jgi:hypothetical protein
MTPFITEILHEVNYDTTKLEKYKDNFALKTVFQYAFQPELKFRLPSGVPPYKKEAAPQGMTISNFYQQVRKFYIFTRTDLKPQRQEELFIQLLEGLHEKECVLCVAIKDQNLTDLYPNLTREILEKYGFINVIPRLPIENIVESKVEEKIIAPREEASVLTLNLTDNTEIQDQVGKPVSPKGPGRPKKEKNKSE